MKRTILTPILACAILLGLVSAARSEIVACRAAIAREAGKLTQARLKARQKCEERAVKSALPLAIDCDADATTAATIAKAESKLRTAIAKRCGGKNKRCDPVDAGVDADDGLVSIGWSLGACPDLEHAGCTTALDDCSGIADCLACVSRAPLDRLLGLTYDALALPSATQNRSLNKCQQAIGKTTVKLFALRATALRKCWEAVNAGRTGFSAPCPSGDSTGKTQAVIAAAAARTRTNLCKACGGIDKACGGGDDWSRVAIGFPAQCPDVALPAGPICGGAVTTLDGLVDCVSCVGAFKADCLDALAVPWGTSYLRVRILDAAESPTPTASPATTPGPSGSAAGTSTPATSATATTTLTPTPTSTRTATPTPGRTPTAAAPTATATPGGSCNNNGIVDPAEECDGDLGCADGEECLANCTCSDPALCGNGVVDAGEECDEVGCEVGQVCLESCTCIVLPRCGNGMVDSGEECDGSGTCADGEECLGDCTCSVTPLCGNEVVDPGEDCDGKKCPDGRICPEDCLCP